MCQHTVGCWQHQSTYENTGISEIRCRKALQNVLSNHSGNSPTCTAVHWCNSV